jgi:hypothetical protein
MIPRAVAVSAALWALAAAAPAADPWIQWTNGTFRGASIYQRRVYPALDGPTALGPGPVGPPHTPADFAALAAQGANLVVLSHPGLFAENPPYVLDTNVQASLDRLVDYAEQAGLWTVIAFRTGPGRSEFSILRDGAGDWFPASLINDGVWTNPAAQAAWSNMWQHTANRYRGRPRLAGYDLMVEPNADDAFPQTYDPPAFYANFANSLLDWNQLHPRLAAAVRGVDTNTPILIGGEGYSSLEWMPWLRTNGAPRVVYTAHQYAPHVYTHQEAAGPAFSYPGVFDADEDGDQDFVTRDWLAAQMKVATDFRTLYRVPVAVTELGCVRWAPNASQFLHDSLSLLESAKVGYALWLWHPAWAPMADEDDFDFLHGTNPSSHSDLPGNLLMQTVGRHWRGEPMPRRVLDFDGDGLSDLGVFVPASGTWQWLASANLWAYAEPWGWSGVRTVPADYDNDRRADLAVFHAAAGNWYIRRSSNRQLRLQNWGWGEVLPVAADYDGDGAEDVAVYHPAAGNWYVLRSGNSQAQVMQWGWSGAKPVPADYNGDGQADPAVYDAATGRWYLRLNGVLSLQTFGGPGYAPQPADYDGDGRADLALWQPAAKRWYVLRSSDAVLRTYSLGSSAALACPADLDGDGLADPAVYQPSSGLWTWILSATGQKFARAWGGPGLPPLRATGATDL